MINTLTNRKLLAKIANKPGKTRLINFFQIKYKQSRPHHVACEVGGDMGGESEPSVPPCLCDSSYPEFRIPNSELFGLVDLPGYGYAKVSKSEREQWQRMIGEFFRTRKQVAGVVVLVDIRHEPDPKDALMIKMLQDLKINFMVAATKCDKIPSSKIAAQLKMLKMGFNLKETFICEFSALKKVGTEKILDWIEGKIAKGKVIIHE
jgi:GTP-binding protein